MPDTINYGRELAQRDYNMAYNAVINAQTAQELASSKPLLADAANRLAAYSNTPFELEQLMSGNGVELSPFGPRSGAPSYEMLMPENVDGVPSAEDLAFAVGGPGGAYAAYRAGQGIRGMYDDAVAANAYASQGAVRPRPGSTYQAGDWYKWITPPQAQEYLHGSASQQALPAGASRAALPAGNDPLALPPRPTFSTPRERVMYDLENAALREQFSPYKGEYARVYPGDVKTYSEPFTTALDKTINQGNMTRVYGPPNDFMPLPKGFDERMAELDNIRFTTGLTPEQQSEYNARWSMVRDRNQAWRAANELKVKDMVALRSMDSQMEKDASRARKPPKETGLGPQGKATIDRLGRLASKAGSTAMSAAGFTGILSQLIKPDPFDPVGNYIIRSNPEAYPEQVSQYNNAVSNMWY